MRRLLMKRNLSVLCRSALRFIDVSACRVMACFLDCFRGRDDHRSTSNLVSRSSLANSRTSQESQNHLSALFQSEEEAASSPCLGEERLNLDSIHIDKGLRDEACFLKACGTIPETPIEIRKASRKQFSSPQHCATSYFHSWISSSSALCFHLDESPTPLKACEEVGGSSSTSEQTPSSCVIDVVDTARIPSASSDADEVESIGTALKGEVDRSGRQMLTAGKTKSVRFECDLDQSQSSNSSENSSSRKPEMGGKSTLTTPNPTPLKLSDEMQTPGTVYPANMESAGRGRPRIRSQFVHSVSNLMEDASLYNVHDDSYGSLEQANSQVYKEHTEGETPTSATYGEERSHEKLSKFEASPWLNPINEDGKENIEVLNDRTPGVNAITPGDRPIIGLVAAHWNEDLQTEISPKWWDGNGIPNSTTKYKEDQKVSWHATPFEVRLEKALSEEGGLSLFPRRNLEVMEEDEEDSDISKLQHSVQPNSVVSF
ncbi:Protein JASON [Raphanus sativus]|uniref:Protein JASON n=1 Tax=Raphanus sativus TaxID=3726 RepID=A0A6J0KUG2_RAPSA|nr:protein JASON [Raphanus sativus]KAJ4871760.1 Protein JASON [Raphanus sativus]